MNHLEGTVEHAPGRQEQYEAIVHAGGVELRHQQIVISVHHQAGQAVSFTVDEPIVGMGIEPLP